MQYEIKGTPFPVVICSLNRGEAMITERGSMTWMTRGLTMETKGGGVGKALGRMFAGEAMFQNIYTAQQDGVSIAFGSSFPGKIIPIELTPGTQFIVQKSGFLASTSQVELSVAFRKQLGAGLFGGEGFIMQRLSGQGTAFVEIDGDVIQYDLAPGQQMVLDTGYLAMMDGSVTMDIETVKGLKNKLLGGEGFFNTIVTGPGRIWIQTSPISNVASALRPFLPSGS